MGARIVIDAQHRCGGDGKGNARGARGAGGGVFWVGGLFRHAFAIRAGSDSIAFATRVPCSRDRRCTSPEMFARPCSRRREQPRFFLAVSAVAVGVHHESCESRENVKFGPSPPRALNTAEERPSEAPPFFNSRRTPVSSTSFKIHGLFSTGTNRGGRGATVRRSQR